MSQRQRSAGNGRAKLDGQLSSPFRSFVKQKSKVLHQCRRQADGRLRLKDVFDLEAEHTRDGKGEWQAGIVPAVLDRIHRLSRDRKRLREIALAPLAAETELLYPVVHR